jgi:hypothetical protein
MGGEREVERGRERSEGVGERGREKERRKIERGGVGKKREGWRRGGVVPG